MSTTDKATKTPEEIMTLLAAPFTKIVGGKSIPNHKWKVQSFYSEKKKCMCVPFVNRTLVSQRLNDVLGLGGWMFELKEVSDGSKIGTLSILINGNWIERSDIGTKTDIEGEKGSASDALKRCATLFGVGQYLENINSKHFSTAAHGRSFVPVDKSGNKLLFDGLTNYCNGMSSKQGLLAEIIQLDKALWSRPEIKALWTEFNL